jgi:hypothetical protein
MLKPSVEENKWQSKRLLLPLRLFHEHLENAGLDPVTTLIALRKAHADGASHAGINVYEGGVVDMKDGNVLEPLRVVEQAIQSATETAIMILRIDDVISSKGVSMADGFGGDGDFHM